MNMFSKFVRSFPFRWRTVCLVFWIFNNNNAEKMFTELEGACPSHVVVMCKGHVFSFQCLDDQNNLLTVPELQAQLQKIIDRAALLPEASGMHYFTALERTSWAEVIPQLLVDFNRTKILLCSLCLQLGICVYMYI